MSGIARAICYGDGINRELRKRPFFAQVASGASTGAERRGAFRTLRSGTGVPVRIPRRAYRRLAAQEEGSLPRATVGSVRAICGRSGFDPVSRPTGIPSRGAQGALREVTEAAGALIHLGRLRPCVSLAEQLDRLLRQGRQLHRDIQAGGSLAFDAGKLAPAHADLRRERVERQFVVSTVSAKRRHTPFCIACSSA